MSAVAQSGEWSAANMITGTMARGMWNVTPQWRKALYLVALFAFFLAAYVITASGDIQNNGDTVIRFTVTQDLVEYHTPALVHWTITKPNKRHPFPDPRVQYGTRHRIYTIYTAGQSLAGIPLYLLGKVLAAHLNLPAYPAELFSYRLVDPIFGSLLTILIFLFCIRLGCSTPLALLMSLVFGFATSAWPDEQSGLELTQESFFVLLGVYLVFRYKHQGKSWLYLPLAGLSVGAALVTRWTAAVAIPPIALYLALPENGSWRWHWPLGRNLLFGFAVVPLLLFDLWYNKLRFGSYTDTGHSEKIFGNPLLSGIGGLVISPGKGLIWYTPAIFLLIVAAPRFARRWPTLATLFFAITASYIVFYGAVQYWHGDPAWGPRYIYPILPYVTIPIAEVFCLRSLWRWPARIAATIVIAVSLAVQFVAVTVSMWGDYYDIVAAQLAHHKKWYWDASQYHYFWNWHQSPLLNQFHHFYRIFLIWTGHSHGNIVLPPVHNPVLSQLINTYPLNTWALWWADPQFNWWIGPQRIEIILVGLGAVALAALLYLVLEASPLAQPLTLSSETKPLAEEAA
jgi:4-amino-4-deoxy-L-arabinose transferase-like glycosyltransferase